MLHSSASHSSNMSLPIHEPAMRDEKDLETMPDHPHALDKGVPDIKTREVNGPLHQDTPPEVKACVPEVDDPSTPCETFRSYLLGTICAVIGTGLNTWWAGAFALADPYQVWVPPTGDLYQSPLGPIHRPSVWGSSL